jgi:hypothetical protein
MAFQKLLTNLSLINRLKLVCIVLYICSVGSPDIVLEHDEKPR